MIKEIDFAKLNDLIESSYQILSDDIVFASGSLIEGLGNKRSDLDVYVLTSKNTSDISQLVNKPLDNFNEFVDLNWKSVSWVEDAICLLENIEFKEPRSFRVLSPAHRDFLHRFRVGVPIKNGERFNKLKERINLNKLSYAKFNIAITEIDSSQIDLMGFLEENDLESSNVKIHDLLMHLIDAYLALHLETSFSQKWKFCKLDKTKEKPLEGFTFAEITKDPKKFFFDLYMFKPRTMDEVNFVSRILILISNIIIPWGQNYFSDKKIELKSFNYISEFKKSDSLPAVSLDFQIRIEDGKLSCFCNLLNRKIEINEELYYLIGLFYGVVPFENTTYDLILKNINISKNELDELIDNLTSMLKLSGMLASS